MKPNSVTLNCVIVIIICYNILFWSKNLKVILVDLYPYNTFKHFPHEISIADETWQVRKK